MIGMLQRWATSVRSRNQSVDLTDLDLLAQEGASESVETVQMHALPAGLLKEAEFRQHILLIKVAQPQVADPYKSHLNHHFVAPLELTLII
jgi:argininosuccinate lyase